MILNLLKEKSQMTFTRQKEEKLFLMIAEV